MANLCICYTLFIFPRLKSVFVDMSEDYVWVLLGISRHHTTSIMFILVLFHFLVLSYNVRGSKKPCQAVFPLLTHSNGFCLTFEKLKSKPNKLASLYANAFLNSLVRKSYIQWQPYKQGGKKCVDLCAWFSSGGIRI